jgi:hypothetical protein
VDCQQLAELIQLYVEEPWGCEAAQTSAICNAVLAPYGHKYNLEAWAYLPLAFPPQEQPTGPPSFEQVKARAIKAGIPLRKGKPK